MGPWRYRRCPSCGVVRPAGEFRPVTYRPGGWGCNMMASEKQQEAVAHFAKAVVDLVEVLISDRQDLPEIHRRRAAGEVGLVVEFSELRGRVVVSVQTRTEQVRWLAYTDVPRLPRRDPQEVR